MKCNHNLKITRNDKCMEKKTIEPVIKRRFLGKLSNFENKQDRNFNKKMLKAYLKGNTNFSFGLTEDTRQPIIYKVLQEYYTPKILGT